VGLVASADLPIPLLLSRTRLHRRPGCRLSKKGVGLSHSTIRVHLVAEGRSNEVRQRRHIRKDEVIDRKVEPDRPLRGRRRWTAFTRVRWIGQAGGADLDGL
jgi:hypothetical protein